MGASWCKQYSKSCTTESSLQEMMTMWANQINSRDEETKWKWNWKWHKRKQNKWKDRPEISAPKLINPCYLQGEKWHNVILSVPDPEMKSRIPVAPPRRKRKQQAPLVPGQVREPTPTFRQTVPFPDLSAPNGRGLYLQTETSSLSSLSTAAPLRHSDRSHSMGPELRRLSFDNCSDCSLRSRTSLASIPVTNELYRKQRFLFETSRDDLMTHHTSTPSIAESSLSRNPSESRLRTLRILAEKYNLTLSLPSLTLGRHFSARDEVMKYTEKRDLCRFSSLPDLLYNIKYPIKDQAFVYTLLYGFRSEINLSLRKKAPLFTKEVENRLKNEERRCTIQKTGSLPKCASQMSVLRGGSYVKSGRKTEMDRDDRNDEMWIKCLVANRQRLKKTLSCDNAFLHRAESESNYRSNRNKEIDTVSSECRPPFNCSDSDSRFKGDQRFPFSSYSGIPRRSNFNKCAQRNFESSPFFIPTHQRGPPQNDNDHTKDLKRSEQIHFHPKITAQRLVSKESLENSNGTNVSNNFSEPRSHNAHNLHPTGSLTHPSPKLSQMDVNELHFEPEKLPSRFAGESFCLTGGLDSSATNRMKAINARDSVSKQLSWTDYSEFNKENQDENSLFKYRSLPKTKSPRCLKTFRRLSQSQSFDTIGCPLFFDKHHECFCLQQGPRAQRFQSFCTRSDVKFASPTPRRCLVKKSLSVNHDQEGRKIDRTLKNLALNCLQNKPNLKKNFLEDRWVKNSFLDDQVKLNHQLKEEDFARKSNRVESLLDLESSRENENEFPKSSKRLLTANQKDDESCRKQSDFYSQGLPSASSSPEALKKENSRRSSISDSLCELEDAIYDLLLVSSDVK